MVNWEEVPAIDENGIIVSYEVQFEPLELTETLTTSSVNTTNVAVMIDGLQEYIQYNISVRAYTSVGPGPYSDPVTERTLEDRKLMNINILVVVYHSVFYCLIQVQPHLLRMCKLLLDPPLRS